jgi:hypothetical protein
MYKTLVKLSAATLLAVAVSSASAGGLHAGVVLETMDSGGYTYAKIDEGGGNQYWIAAPQTKVSKGDKVTFSEQMWMHGFSSSTLNRTFDRILFVGAIGTGSMPVATTPMAGHPPVAQTPLAVPSEPVAKLEGGYTVAEIYAGRGELKGQTVKVRGRVVKVLRKIMGMDWVHIQDGSGKEGSNDLVLRSKDAPVSVGDVVIAQGKVVVDQDFGYGYVYPVLLEEATFTK